MSLCVIVVRLYVGITPDNAQNPGAEMNDTETAIGEAVASLHSNVHLVFQAILCTAITFCIDASTHRTAAPSGRAGERPNKDQW
jgi:hypothetical protein